MSRVRLPKEGRLVIVKWSDSSGTSAWHERGDTLQVVYNETVGWLTGRHRDRVVLSGSHSDGTAAWGQRTAIPTCNITDVRKIKIGKRA